MERTEAITIFENERCRKIYAMQHRPQIFFQKDNICAGKTNLENIKIVSVASCGDSGGRENLTQIGLICFSFVFQIENQWSVADLHRWGNRKWWTQSKLFLYTVRAIGVAYRS